MKVYQPLEYKDEVTGKFYKEFDIPDGMPIEQTLVLIAPPENLKYPRYNSKTGLWVEDKDSIIEEQKKTINELLIRTDVNEQSILELISMVGGK